LDISQENINELLAAVEHIVDHQYRYLKIKITKVFYPLPMMAVDRKKIMKAFLTILEACIEALPQYGGLIHLNTKVKDGQIEILISHDGTPLREEDKAQLFFPFQQNGRGNGFGLGLAYAQKVIHDHLGEISVETISGGRTCFRIVLQSPVLGRSSDI